MYLERQPLRTPDDLKKDGLWPMQGAMGEGMRVSTRHSALYEVLSCIPPNDYAMLGDSIDSWHWFIPDESSEGCVLGFPATVYPEPDPSTGLQLREFAQVIFLSPGLEKRAMSYVVGIVAHELAHIVLGHRETFQESENGLEADEEAAWDRIREWGFGRETKDVECYRRWLESWEETAVRKLKQQLELDGS
jgi:hypothetical protein